MATPAQDYIRRLVDGRFPFQPNGLYLLLSDIKDPGRYHWGLYLSIGRGHGRVFNMVNSEKTNWEWDYQEGPTSGVPGSINLLIAFKLGDIEPDWHEALALRLSMVSRDEPISCRVWAKRALSELDGEDYIKLGRSVEELENYALMRLEFLPKSEGQEARIF